MSLLKKIIDMYPLPNGDYEYKAYAAMWEREGHVVYPFIRGYTELGRDVFYLANLKDASALSSKEFTLEQINLLLDKAIATYNEKVLKRRQQLKGYKK